MTKRTYHIEHQRLSRDRGGYTECAPHAASRVVIIETTIVPAKRGQQRYFHRRIVDTFCGPQAAARAGRQCGRLTASTRSKPQQLMGKIRGVYARSLTIAEYDALLERKREEGSF